MHTRSPVFTAVAPAGTAAPLSYSPAVLVRPTARTLFISGQVGIDSGGEVAGTFAEQAALACKNLLGVLSAAGMAATDIVKTTVYLTNAEHIAAWRITRNEVLGAICPASTLVVVSALVDPQWQIEIEAIAADGGEQ